jgi:hypothetical protein
MNPDDRPTTCRVCGTDRNVVPDAGRSGAGWICMSCGKRVGVKHQKCPVCNAPRYSEMIDREESPPPDRFDRSALGKLAGGAFVACLLLAAVMIWLNRGPSEETVKVQFEKTELARINSGFVGGSIDNLVATRDGSPGGLAELDAMLQRMTADCGDRLPSAVLQDQVRQGFNPERFKSDLVKLGRAVDRYLGGRIGPFGRGYALKGIRVIESRKSESGENRICTVEYEATLKALGDVSIYRPPYLAGQEHTPLVENGSIDWDRFDRFYQAYKGRNSSEALAAAAEFDRNRESKVCSAGGTQLVRGKMTFVKTDYGWIGTGGTAF